MEKAIAEVVHTKEIHKEAILKKPNVVGTGVGFRYRNGKPTNELAVVAMVTHKLPRAGLKPGELLPRTVGGVPVDVIQVGRLRAYTERTDRWRPAPGGVSIGHYQVTAGTLACNVQDRKTGRRLMLSNNHVLANSNKARIGDPILQPGPADGGKSGEDVIGYLERFEAIEFNAGPASCPIASAVADVANGVAALMGSSHRLRAVIANPLATNRVDAALAKPAEEGWLRDDVLEIGVIGGVSPARLGMGVRKYGRTTGLTQGMLQVMDATVTVMYGDLSARFDGQLVTTAMSEPGDSGSLVVADDALLALGLLFAGSNQATILNPMQTVLDTLEVTL
ncbi:MAG: hypothetical protein PVF49_03535 [Anaerolineales bacterium]